MAVLAASHGGARSLTFHGPRAGCQVRLPARPAAATKASPCTRFNTGARTRRSRGRMAAQPRAGPQAHARRNQCTR